MSDIGTEVRRVEGMLVDAALRRQRHLDAMAAVRKTWEGCERIGLDSAERNDGGGPCWLDRPVKQLDGMGTGEYANCYEESKPGGFMHAEYIAEHWCPSCQRNEPKVRKYYQMAKSKGGLASTVARLARRLDALIDSVLEAEA